MPRGDKSAYTGKQKRMAKHIEESYESRGVSRDEAEGRAWATVNKETGGGKLSGSGRARAGSGVSDRKGGSTTPPTRPAADRSAAARKGWQTRRIKVV